MSARFMLTKAADGVTTTAIVDFAEVAYMAINNGDPNALIVVFKGNGVPLINHYDNPRPAREALNLFEAYTAKITLGAS